MGRNQLMLLKFAIKFANQWHTYGKDRGVINAVNSLEKLELIEVDRTSRMFILKRPDYNNDNIVKEEINV